MIDVRKTLLRRRALGTTVRRAAGWTGTAGSRRLPDRRQPEGSARPAEVLAALFGEDVAQVARISLGLGDCGRRIRRADPTAVATPPAASTPARGTAA